MAGRIRVDVIRYGRKEGGKTLAVTVGETPWEEFIDLAAKRLGLNHQPPSSVVYALSTPSEDSTEEPKYLSSLAEISHGDLVQFYQWDGADLAKASTTPRTIPRTTPRTTATPRAVTPRTPRPPEEDGDDIPPPPPPLDDDDDIPPPPPPPPPELSPRQAPPASPSASTQEAPKWRGFQLRPREGPLGFTLRSLPLGASTSSPALGSLLSSLSTSTSTSSSTSSASSSSSSSPSPSSSSSTSTSESTPKTDPGNSVADSASASTPSSPLSTTATSTTSQESPSPTRPPNSPSRSNWLTAQKASDDNRSPTLQRSSTQPILGRRQSSNLTLRGPATPTPNSPLGGRGGVVLSAASVSSAARSVVRPPSMKVLTFDVFYFSVFQTNDNSHVLLELDCQQQMLRRWRKEKPLPPLPFAEIASHSTSPAGSTVTLQLQFKTQPGGVFHVLSPEEADNLTYVLNCVQTRLFSVIGEKKPRLCIKKGFVNIERKGLMKKSSSMYVVITDKKVFGFADEDMMLPLVAIDLRGASVTKRKGSDIVIDYKQFKQLTFTFSLEPMRDFWYDSLTRAIEITDQKINELQQLMDDVRQFYGLPYENEDPDHVALLQDLWNLTIYLNPDKAQLSFNPRRSDHWKLIGFQREDPVSDLRAVGLLGLKHLIYLARHYPELFKEQVEKQNSSNSPEMEYPFATVGINITYLLVDIFKLAPEKPLPLPLSETYPIWFYHPRAFDELYCLTFRLFDRIWLEMMVGYMGFQKVIDRTKDRLVELLGRPPVQGVPAIFDMLGVILDTNTH